MKRRLIICSSLITIILSCFSFPIFAEEAVQDSSTIHTLSDGVFLDSYFYDNYDLLPYLQSTGSQVIDTSLIPNSDYSYRIKFSDPVFGEGINAMSLFGVSEAGNNIYVNLLKTTTRTVVYMASGNSYFSYDYYPYVICDLLIDQSNVYFNNSLITTLSDYSYQCQNPLYVFAYRNGSNSSGMNKANFKLYSFSVYDNSSDEFVRYYYPAKSKTSDTLGLYDAVNKTFITTTNLTYPFVNPSDDQVQSFEISSFLSASLGWIGQIFTAIIDMPIIIIFMAIGLAGAMFRWGRRIVRF